MANPAADQCMRSVEIVEVSPRDGLQNEQKILSSQDKLTLIEHAVAAGARRIEVTSFVNPKRVPQMADAAELAALLPRRADVTYIGLVLNARGADRAIAAGLDELGAVCVASDSFALRNQGQTASESLAVAKQLVTRARQAGRSGQITIGASFGCPFEGEVDADLVLAMALSAAEVAPREVTLADTIGVAVPAAVGSLVAQVHEAIFPIPVRAHFHDTRNTGIANVWAAIQAGASTIDASLGGAGGCPFAPRATGNVATEDVVYLLGRSGIETGYDLARTIAGATWLTGALGRPLPGSVSKAGDFPSPQRYLACRPATPGR